MENTTKTASMHIRVNLEARERALEVLDEIGISVSDLFNMLLNQVAIQQRIPFELITSKYVCAHGHIHDYSGSRPSTDDDKSVFKDWAEAKEWLNA